MVSFHSVLYISFSLSYLLTCSYALTHTLIGDAVISYRSLALGYEVFRIGYPGLVHYHHTKKGMWESAIK